MVRKKVNKTGCTATSQIWCPWRGLNTRPLPYQGSALPLSYMGKIINKSNTYKKYRPLTGAGEGNRTLVVSLEGFCSTIELHPPDTFEKTPCHTTIRESANNPKQPNTQHTKSRHLHPQKHLQKTWWRGKDSNLRRLSQQIYSLPPLTAREPLRTKPTIIVGSDGCVNESARKMPCRPGFVLRQHLPAQKTTAPLYGFAAGWAG